MACLPALTIPTGESSWIYRDRLPAPSASTETMGRRFAVVAMAWVASEANTLLVAYQNHGIVCVFQFTTFLKPYL